MLGAKGDSIIDQMEDLTIEKPNAAQPERAPIPNAVSSKEVDNVSGRVAVCWALHSMVTFIIIVISSCNWMMRSVQISYP